MFGFVSSMLQIAPLAHAPASAGAAGSAANAATTNTLDISFRIGAISLLLAVLLYKHRMVQSLALAL